MRGPVKQYGILNPICRLCSLISSWGWNSRMSRPHILLPDSRLLRHPSSGGFLFAYRYCVCRDLVRQTCNNALRTINSLKGFIIPRGIFRGGVFFCCRVREIVVGTSHKSLGLFETVFICYSLIKKNIEYYNVIFIFIIQSINFKPI